MTSKNSFLANLKENNKRRAWLWILSWLFWFVYYPVGMVMVISRQETVRLARGYSEKMAEEHLLEAVRVWLLSGNRIYMLIVSLIAVICAVQGFSYLYSKKKVDFYHSVPVKKSRRFAVIYLNGIFIFLLPYMACFLLAILLAGLNGAMGGDNASAALTGLLRTVMLFLGTYGLAAVAVMMTGNLVITAFAVTVFMVYEFVLRLLLHSYCGHFYKYFSVESVNTVPFFSPIGQMVISVDRMGKASSWSAAIPNFLLAAVMAIVFAWLSWFCYKIRPAEATGKAMAFPKTKGIVKILLVIPFSLGTGMLVQDLIGETPYGMMIFGMALAVVVGSCVIEVIYEADIRAIFHKKYQILAAGGGVALIFLTFSCDLLGFDRWEPDPDKLEDTVVLFMGDMYGAAYLDTDLNSVNNKEHFLAKPGIRDHEAICELSARRSEEGELWCTMAYRMKSGRVVWRNFALSGEEEELLNRVVGSREYREAQCLLFDEEIYEVIKKQEITDFCFSTGFWKENLPLSDMDVFREAYLKDLEKRDYSMLKKEFVCGKISFSAVKEMEDGYMDRTFWYEIYPSYTNTLAFLEERGLSGDGYLDVDMVESITVKNRHTEMYAPETGNGDMAAAMADVKNYAVTKVFNDAEQIRELADALYPNEFDTYWMQEGAISEDYEVTVQYKNGLTDSSYYRGNEYARLIADRIPAWLERETAYE